MTRRAILAFAILALLVAVPIHAQTGLGTLSGYVLSVDGTRVPNARVYLQPGNGRAAHTMLTNAEGHYSFAKVRPGMYDLRAHASDSWTEQKRNVVVRANQEVNVDLKMTAPAKPKSDSSPPVKPATSSEIMGPH